MTADIVTLAARDPIFRLAAELRLHLSETDGRLMVNSREVARVFFHRRHRPLLRKIMEGMWNIPMRPDWEGQFRMLADGSVEMTAPALALALGGWGCRNKRVVQFHIDWVNLVCAKADEQEARTDVNFLTEGI